MEKDNTSFKNRAYHKMQPHFWTVQFSEEYLLTTCFNKLPSLTCLYLPSVCTDDMLSQLALCCPSLQVLSVEGSTRVTDAGVSMLINPASLQVKKKRPAVDLRDPGTRVGFQATPIIAGFTDQLKMYKVS